MRLLPAQKTPDVDKRVAQHEPRRLQAYLLALSIAFALYTVLFGLSGGWMLLVCAAVLGALAAALLQPSRSNGEYRIAALSSTAAAVVALVFPLGLDAVGGTSLPEAVARSTIWPQFLVALFAGRVLSEVSALRFAKAWRRPLSGTRMATQSLSAAVISGCSFVLLFYKVVGSTRVAADRLDPAAIIERALSGHTAVHVAIVLLFFVTLAAILDAALLLASDRLALAEFRQLCADALQETGRLDRGEIGRLLANALDHHAHSRAVQLVQFHMRSVSGGGADGLEGPLQRFHLASRRMIRSLLSFLPLLGFLGTVIGLTAAIGGLPRHLGPGAEGSLDISASLVGLAIKFETTLLGLAGGLLASLFLAILEKREGELSAECHHLVESLLDKDQKTAAGNGDGRPGE